MIERIFKLTENKTNVRTEVLAGVTTFLTMAYIIFVQPAVLSGKMFGTDTGMDFGAVTTATCLSAALATVIMALYARYPIAQGPGMGENFFFVFSALPAATAARFRNAWQVALGVVFVSGVLFLILSLVGLRELIFNAVSPSLKNAIAAGIGLFIAFIGINCRRPGARIYQLHDYQGLQRSQPRNQLADLCPRDRADVVFRFCAEPNGLAQLIDDLHFLRCADQASSSSGLSERGGIAVAVAAWRRKTGRRVEIVLHR
jgi:hypothetical protein